MARFLAGIWPCYGADVSAESMVWRLVAGLYGGSGVSQRGGSLATVLQRFPGRALSCAAPYPHPGVILLEELLKPMGIMQYRLAKEIGVPQRRIGEIVAGIRGVTADTGLRLARFFGMSEGFWIGLQVDYEAAITKDALSEILARIRPWRVEVQQRAPKRAAPALRAQPAAEPGRWRKRQCLKTRSSDAASEPVSR